MEINLEGCNVAIVGDRNPIAATIVAELAASGAQAAWASPEAASNGDPPAILLLSCGLDPSGSGGDVAGLTYLAQAVAHAMARRGSGRIVVLLSALGIVPMRRYPAYSAAMAGVAAALRGLAMQVAPAVLVNGLGIGLVTGDEGTVIAGDAAMASHSASPQPIRTQEVADAALFLCDPLNSYMTGQVLVVDGGWSTGYGRNF